ncbi:MAG: biopolymer transport protein ExbB/TolQ [Myxococcota bacterium]|jgi:biopolymer transport protein ExbB/TolQ
MLTEKLSNFFDAVGAEWVMYLLLALGFGALIIIVERILFYRHRAVDIDRLRRAMDAALTVGDTEKAIAQAEASGSLEGRVVAEGIRAVGRGPEAVGEVIASAQVTARVEYDRFLPFLGTLGNNAPFIGLFGTVLGIINAFGALKKAGQSADRAKAIMGDISEALVATAVGLLVAIPSVIAYNYFKGLISQRISHTDALTHTLMAHLKERERGKGGS